MFNMHVIYIRVYIYMCVRVFRTRIYNYIYIYTYIVKPLHNTNSAYNQNLHVIPYQ